MTQSFIVTKDRRFTEFANAVKKERTIGIRHGDACVGKTNSARRSCSSTSASASHTATEPTAETNSSSSSTDAGSASDAL